MAHPLSSANAHNTYYARAQPTAASTVPATVIVYVHLYLCQLVQTSPIFPFSLSAKYMYCSPGSTALVLLDSDAKNSGVVVCVGHLEELAQSVQELGGLLVVDPVARVRNGDHLVRGEQRLDRVLSLLGHEARLGPADEQRGIREGHRDLGGRGEASDLVVVAEQRADVGSPPEGLALGARRRATHQVRDQELADGWRSRVGTKATPRRNGEEESE